MPSWVFYTAAVCLQWFDWFDNADGVRARRLKCGSPIGRIVDEALDLINQTITPVLIVYGCSPDNCLLEYLTLIMNITFFTMEMQFIISRKLIMMEAGIGPVELNLINTVTLAMIGYLTTGFF